MGPAVSNSFFMSPVTSNEIEHEICKSNWPYSIPINLLKLLKSSLSTPLELIYNHSFATGVVPNQFKLANYIPIHKKRPQTMFTNQNIKRSVYCQYGYYSLTFRALALRQRETGFSVSLWRREKPVSLWQTANARNVRHYYPYWQYTHATFIPDYAYRPISLLPIFNKILEKMLHKRLIKYIDEYNILYNKQFGFHSNRSTLQASLLYYRQYTEEKREGLVEEKRERLV